MVMPAGVRQMDESIDAAHAVLRTPSADQSRYYQNAATFYRYKFSLET